MNRTAGTGSDSAVMGALLQKNLPLFHALSEEQAALLKSYFSWRQVTAGQELWHEGDSGEYLAFILSGRMQLKKDTEFRGKQVVVGVFSPGAVVGELSFSRNHARVVTAAALEDCQLALLTRSSFDALVNDHPALGVMLLEAVLQAACKRLEKSYQRLAAIF